MNKIFSASIIAISACISINSYANAQTAVNVTAKQSGNVSKTCAIGATNGTLNPVANNITGTGGLSGNFPRILSSATEDGGIPGSFITLCNTNPSQISIQVVGGTSGVTVPLGQTGHTTRYTLSSSSSVYPGDILDTPFGPTITVTSSDVNYALGKMPATLNVSAKITASTNKVLVGTDNPNAYSLGIIATLTP